MEKTIELDIPLLLPGIENEKDACLSRLEAALQNRKGILRAHLERDKSPVDLCLHYDPNLLTLSEVRRIAEQAGAYIINRFHHTSIPIEGMDCSDCSLVIEHSVGRMEGVLAAAVNYAAETIWVEFDNQKTSRSAIEKRLRSLGYTIPLNGFQKRLHENRELLFSLNSGLLLLIGWLVSQFPAYLPLLPAVFYLAAYLFGGWDTARHAWSALRERRFDTDLLMIMAAAGAAILGNLAEGALLLFLFSLGHSLESRLLNRARNAVRLLAELAPKTALVRRDGKEVDMPVEALLIDDRIILPAGVRIPADGVILTGRSSLNQASVTGESLPVDKAPGDPVFAGTLNGEGSLEVRVTRLAKDSTLRRVMKMVEEAQSQKSPTQQTVEKFERIFVPAVLILTALTILIPPLFGFPFRQSFLRAMTLLVAVSPCALALGAPAAILAGVAQAARNGVLVKGGAHLENLGRLKVVAFDKTGTLTHGQPEVTGIISIISPLEGDGVAVASSPRPSRERIGGEGLPPLGVEGQHLLSLAASAESRSAHPLARAILRCAQAQAVPFTASEEVESLTGRGLRLVSNGTPVWIGSRKLMEEAGISLPAEALQQAQTLEQEGKTLMWVAEGQVALGLIALADTLRDESAPTMQALKRKGIEHTIMLTGDNPRSASAIAAQAGVTDFRAGLLPEDKLAAIRELVQHYGQVAMVGDGINDAPALAHATVGIAMGGASSDIALETADVALMGNDLSRLPFAVGLGRLTRSIILQNLAVALGVILLLAAASLTGLVTMGTAVVFHEGSTLVVVANALRLLGYRESSLSDNSGITPSALPG